METFGDRLSILRKKSKLNVKNLANKIGISIQAWTDYEKNRSMPQIDKLIKISEYFKVSIDYLIYGNNISNFSATIDDNYSSVITCLAEMCKYGIISPKKISNLQEPVIFESSDEYIKMFIISYFEIKDKLSKSFNNDDICEMCKSLSNNYPFKIKK